jgi:type VI secretion system protein ImpK
VVREKAGAMSDDSSGEGNRTVFRPSPLSGLRKKAPEGPTPGGDPFASAPAAPPSSAWAVPPPPPATPASDWSSPAAPAQPARPAFGSDPPPEESFASAPARDPLAPSHDRLPAAGPVRAALNDDDIPIPARQPNIRAPLVTEAGSLLALAASIRSGRAGIAMQDFHRLAVEQIAEYDRRIAQIYPEEVRLRARYALCATIDDIAQNLPNIGQDGAEWARRSLVVQFFRENIGGERFWTLVDDLLRNPRQNAQLIELFAACLAAGFEGKYRVRADGRGQLQQIMKNLFGALEHPRAQSTVEIVPQWRGVDAPAAKIGLWNRVALAAAVAAAGLLAVFMVLQFMLMTAGLDNAVYSLTPTDRDSVRLARSAPPAVVPPQSTQLERLRQFLAPEIRQGLVVVENDASTVRIRTTAGQLFKSGSDQLEAGRAELFERIGRAIEGEPGKVKVEGHSDSDRIAGTLEFPDNNALSKARAQTVADILGKALSNPGRIAVEGLGDSRPISLETTPEGKALNRRVEIVIPRQP